MYKESDDLMVGKYLAGPLLNVWLWGDPGNKGGVPRLETPPTDSRKQSN